jgi:hypothetical protein
MGRMSRLKLTRSGGAARTKATVRRVQKACLEREHNGRETGGQWVTNTDYHNAARSLVKSLPEPSLLLGETEHMDNVSQE